MPDIPGVARLRNAGAKQLMDHNKNSEKNRLASLFGNDSDILSLFCGAGGLDLGFESVGFDIAAAFDIRVPAIASYNHNRQTAHKVGKVKDIREIDVEYLDKILERKFEPIGVIGGPPCQSFSRATHSTDDDPRHDLPLKYAQLLKALNKRSPVHFFAFENVPGLLKRKHAKRFEEFLAEFDAAGFNVSYTTLDAINFGVPQFRPRLIIVGFNKELYGGIKWSPPNDETHSQRTVKKAIFGLPEPTYWAKGIDASKINHHPNHWCMVPKSISFSTPGRLTPGTSRGRSFRTLDWEKPSPTVAYGNREVHIHPNCKRRLSVYEALLLQGFPPTYEIIGSLSSQITQVSEAVPPPLAAAIARSIIDSLLASQVGLEICEVV